MKKLALSFVLMAGLAISFTSCSKETCYECTHDDTTLVDVDICESDYEDNATQLEAAKTALELTGYDCKEK